MFFFIYFYCLKFIFYFVSINVCLYFVHVHHICAWFPERPEKEVGSYGTGVPDSCEKPCRCWESNPSPLEDHLVLLAAEPSLQPQQKCFASHKRPLFMNQKPTIQLLGFCLLICLFVFGYFKLQIKKKKL